MPAGQSFGFVGPAYQLENVAADCQDVVNLYPKRIESGDGASRDSKYAYFNRPGLSTFATLPGGNVRCLWGGNNRLFAVGGAHLYEVLGNGSTVDFGAMASASGPAQIVVTPFGVSAAVVVWDGTSGATENVWVFDGVNPPTAVISAVGIGFIDGYIVALRPPIPPGNAGGLVPINTNDGDQINISTPLNPFEWQPLDYAIRSGAPDQVQAIYTPGSIGGPGPEELWWLGKRTTEVWYNTGGSNLNSFPFQRVPGAFIGRGIWAKNSAAAVRNTILFLDGDDRGVGVVQRMAGYIPQRVSTHAVEQAIQSYAQAGIDTSDAIGYGEQFEGHDFYVLNFPTANKTWAYDLTENLWHRRAFGGTTNAQKGWYHAWTLGRHFLGDGTSGNIYVEDQTLFQDAGTPITFQRTAPHLNLSNKWSFYKQFELYQGGQSSQTRTYSLEISRNKGFTFGAAKSQTIAGDRRFAWRTLGRARDLVVRVTSTDNYEQCWIDGFIDSEQGTGN